MGFIGFSVLSLGFGVWGLEGQLVKTKALNPKPSKQLLAASCKAAAQQMRLAAAAAEARSLHWNKAYCHLI